MTEEMEPKKTTLLYRFDRSHQQLQPHLLKKSDQLLVRMICRKIEQQEISAREVGVQLQMFDDLPGDLLALVNETLPGHKKKIRDPVHAAVMVGGARLRTFLSQYVELDPLDPLDTTGQE